MQLATIALMFSSMLLVEADPKVVSMQFDKRRATTDLEKRSPFTVNLNNDLTLYEVTVAVGTPQQTVRVQIDTGSSDTWLPSFDVCRPNLLACTHGWFDPSKSSTFTTVNKTGFRIGYGDNSGSGGDLITDNVGIGGVEINNLTMGLETNGTRYFGILGVGFSSNEAGVPKGLRPAYPNIMDTLVTQKLINTRAFSLYLDSPDAKQGTILFGGFDTEKLDGELAILNMQPSKYGPATEFNVDWSWLSITDDTGTNLVTGSDFSQSALLDTGASYIVAPDNVFNEVATYFNATLKTLPSGNFTIVSCEWRSKNGTIDFGFERSSSPIISIPFSEMISSQQVKAIFADGTPACALGVVPQSTVDFPHPILGDPFLRSAYVIYSLDDQLIGIAPSISNSTSSNVTEITGNGLLDSIGSIEAVIATSITVTQTASDPLLAPASAPATTQTQTITAKPPATTPDNVTGVKTSITRQTNAVSSASVPTASATNSKSAASTALPPSMLTRDLLLVCGTVAAMIMGGAMTVML